MHLRFLFEVFGTHREDEALIWQGGSYSYGWLAEKVDEWSNELERRGVQSGAVVAVEADFSPDSVALLVSLLARNCIFVPLTTSVRAKRDEFLNVCQAEHIVQLVGDNPAHFEHRSDCQTHAFYDTLRDRGAPGLVLFSSGSTGTSKAAVHDVVPMLEKFKRTRHRRRSISFLLYDHIGGFNTLLYNLSNGGCIVTVPSRDPETVLRSIQDNRVDLLPTSPTFLNLILLSEAYKRYDLSSLRLVTYGTEPMPESTLRRFHEILPEVELLQTYGLSEVGILRSKSKASDSLWVKIGGEGFETRVVDGLLEVRAASAMLGYLNAESPFTEDGWFRTGDAVLVDGQYFRILGRVSEIINVGGEKVYPAEVESVIQTIEGVCDVEVYGEANAIMGQVVCARISTGPTADARSLRKKIKRECRQQLEPFMVPVKVEIADKSLHGERFKKQRRHSS